MNGRIKNDDDWFLVSGCEQLEVVGSPKNSPERRCRTWVNTILVNARSIPDAYAKALALARAGNRRYRASSGETCYWKVVGVWDVTPIQNDIADSEEIYWEDRGDMSVRKALSWCVTRGELLRRHEKWIAHVADKRKTTSNKVHHTGTPRRGSAR